MKVAPHRLDRLARLLHDKVGLHVRDESRGALILSLLARVGSSPAGETIDRYLDALENDEAELRALLPLVTVGKTSFFRDERQFTALSQILPDLLATARREGRRLSIWSAACATGEEVWSLAMATREAGAEASELDLLGTDVNPKAVEFAKVGLYPAARLEGLDPLRRQVHFQGVAGQFAPRADLARLPRFAPHNLIHPTYPLPANGAGWDLVFCRNVLIYFDLPTAQLVLQRLFDVIRPGGWLFLGYSESLFRVFDGFELVEQGGAFVYRKPTQRPIRIQIPPPPQVSTRPPTPAESRQESKREPVDGSRRWFESIHQRIALQIDRGDFEEARAALETHVEDEPGDLAAWLTLANLYGLMRLFDRSEACYETALEMEPLRAESHLFSGIHLLARGDLERATQALSRALFLEPELVIAHYFLGRCRERGRDLEGARRSYRAAIRSHRDGMGSRRFLGHYPDLPEDGGSFARAAESALVAL